MVLLAAFQTLLHRYSGQTDICVGTPVAGRMQPDTERMIGFFLNTLVVRTDFADDPSFHEVLRRVRQASLEAYAHQNLPFEQLVEALHPVRDLSHAPLFQVSFSMLNAPTSTAELPGLTMQPFQGESTTAKFDLALLVAEGGGGLTAQVEYNTDLFEAATIARLLQHFTRLLEGITADPEQHVSDLPLLTEAERQQLLLEWNKTEAVSPADGCIHALFEAQVERSPDAVAVVCEEAQLTFRALNARANQVAYRLQSLGVGPEVMVGVYAERSLETVIALWAILKAGGVYVPLDPVYPKERLAFMLKDTQAPVLLTQARLVERLPASEVEVICLDADREAMAPAYEENPDSGVMAENLAYVIYTSGSTGQPKGVLISHGAIANHCRAVQQHYQLTPRDHVLQFASLAFDASLEQIFAALIAGARLVLRDEEVWAAADLQQKALDLGLTVINVPPAYWHQLALEWAEAPEQVPPPLRLVIIGGDVMQPETLHLWWQTPMQAARLLNAYGPTETTITATTFEVPVGFNAQLSDRRIPIGRPQADRQVYILDLYGHPTPIGVPGELCLGGAYLARGYLNQPELTADRFIPNSFSHKPGERLYKSGDLARYLPDGTIEFLGRIDQQVKMRGFRIELGEIEAVLGQQPAVQEVVVIAREDDPGSKRLVAYLVANPTPAIAALRDFMRQKLPEYMVPGAFVFLDALPVTTTGKVDRRALPAPDKVRPGVENAYIAPRTPIEAQLTEIAAQLLGVARVGIDDNFFDLGGHSLLATQFLSRIRASFQVEVPLRSLFEKPSIAQIAADVEQARESATAPGAPPIARISRESRRAKRSQFSWHEP
jgi:amino acid adenylation domain-containing protein